MILSRQNILSGACVAAFSLLLLSQTYGVEGAVLTEGIHPMDYPRMLIWLLLGLGIFIALTPAKEKAGDGGVRTLTRRTVSLSLVLLAYALLFEPLGFALSSFLGATACAWVMGWRRHMLLLLTNSASIIVIWVLFRYGLKIPLPTGTLW